MLVSLTIENTVATITLQRAEAANALSVSLLHEMKDVLQKIASNSAVRVVILCAEGEKAFCAGADLKERKQMTDTEAMQTIALINDVINAVEQLPKPVLAAINGVAFGGGLELALACDIRIASEHVKLGLTETSLGIIPGAGGTQRLPRLIGIGKAKELIFTAKHIGAVEAKELGIVEHVVESSQLRSFTHQLAEQIAKNAPLSLLQAKRAINLGMQTDLTSALHIEALCYQQLFNSNDRQEGLLAFTEKRKPNYSGS